MQKTGGLIVFVNGKIGMGSPPAGFPYWNNGTAGELSSFVLAAQRFFGTTNCFFVKNDYSWFSGPEGRKKTGKLYTTDWLASIEEITNCNSDNYTIDFVCHSMGTAFAVGMIDFLLEKSFRVRTLVAINTFQAAKTELSWLYKNYPEPDIKKPIVIDYQNSDDPVIHNPFRSAAGQIPGALIHISEPSGLNDMYTVHRSPIWFQGGEFWDKISRQLKMKANEILVV
jgi:pimeloyl-ACP methyl ester carboxylesterase